MTGSLFDAGAFQFNSICISVLIALKQSAEWLIKKLSIDIVCRWVMEKPYLHHSRGIMFGQPSCQFIFTLPLLHSSLHFNSTDKVTNWEPAVSLSPVSISSSVVFPHYSLSPPAFCYLCLFLMASYHFPIPIYFALSVIRSLRLVLTCILNQQTYIEKVLIFLQ